MTLRKQIHKPRREVISGVYKLTHKPSGKFYIGSSTDIRQRFHIHKSLFKHNKNHNKLQETYNTTNQIVDWKLQVIEICHASKLNKTEQMYIKMYINDPWCLNVMPDGRAGKRGTTTKTKSRHKIAMALLGKNTKDAKLKRPDNLVFISPTGKRYENIISVKRFAKEHNLLQSSMNSLANGMHEHIAGWTVEGGPLPDVGEVHDIWPRKRLLEHYPEYTVIDPNGKIYKTFSLWHLEQEYNMTVAKKPLSSGFGVSSRINGLNSYGQGWRLDNIPTFTIVWQGKTYTNVISPTKFCETFNIRTDRFIRYLSIPRINMRKYHIQKD